MLWWKAKNKPSYQNYLFKQPLAWNYDKIRYPEYREMFFTGQKAVILTLRYEGEESIKSRGCHGRKMVSATEINGLRP
jgi:hypothetical protein